MIPMTLAEVAACTDGVVVGADSNTVVTGFASVDSRSVAPHGLFVAVAGQHIDGHEFAPAAVAGGAAGCLVSRPVDAPAVHVADTVVALGRLAAELRTRLTDCMVVAITGSQGKTSTKDLVHQLLARRGEAVASAGSFNNEIGLPLTVLRATATTRYLVLEMGARAPGDITYLCDLARPDIGLVLNVGVAHVGEFGTRAEIARAKGELVESLPVTGTAVLNLDDPLVAAMGGRTSAEVVTYGEDPRADVRLDQVCLDAGGYPGMTLSHGDDRAAVTLRLLGEHSARNGVAAAAVALTAGMALSDVTRGLSEATATSRWRMEPHERPDGVLVLNDAYNANPDSMLAALRTLVSVGRGRRRTVAVLGEMLELGAASRAEHMEVGRLVRRSGVDRLVVVGDGARAVHEGALAAGAADGEESVVVADVPAALDLLTAELRPGDVVLVKGSRGVGLEVVAEALAAASEGDG